MRNVEVNEQSKLISTQFQVRENLREVQRQQFFDGLQLDDDAVFDDEVYSVGRVQLNALIDDWQSHLMPECQSIFRELIAQTGIVRAFQAAGAERSVHGHRSAENSFCNCDVQTHVFSSVSSVSSVVESLDVMSVVQAPVL